jgi:hypothetical protein
MRELVEQQEGLRRTQARENRQIFAAWMLLSLALLWALVINVAAFYDWRVTIWFSRFGEQWFEVVLLNGLAAFAAYHLWKTLRH